MSEGIFEKINMPIKKSPMGDQPKESTREILCQSGRLTEGKKKRWSEWCNEGSRRILATIKKVLRKR